jgi:hypothetical protein
VFKTLRVSLALAVTAGVALFVTGYRNVNGHCGATDKIPTVETISDRLIQNTTLSAENTKYLNRLIPELYPGATDIEIPKSLAAFKQLNPDCCKFYSSKDVTPAEAGRYRVVNDLNDPSLYLRATGFVWRSIMISYSVPFTNAAAQKQFFVIGQVFWVDGCGQRVHAPLKYIVG